MGIIDIAPVVKGMSGADSLAIVGPILEIQVEVPDALASQFQKAGITLPNPITGHALIDTGSPVTVLDLGVIRKLKLELIGMTDDEIGHGNERKIREKYAVRLVFPRRSLPPLDVIEIVGLDLNSIVSPKGKIETIMLLGRDILRDFLFVYNGPKGSFTLAG